MHSVIWSQIQAQCHKGDDFYFQPNDYFTFIGNENNCHFFLKYGLLSLWELSNQPIAYESIYTHIFSLSLFFSYKINTTSMMVFIFSHMTYVLRLLEIKKIITAFAKGAVYTSFQPRFTHLSHRIYFLLHIGLMTQE